MLFESAEMSLKHFSGYDPGSNKRGSAPPENRLHDRYNLVSKDFHFVCINTKIGEPQTSAPSNSFSWGWGVCCDKYHSTHFIRIFHVGSVAISLQI